MEPVITERNEDGTRNKCIEIDLIAVLVVRYLNYQSAYKKLSPRLDILFDEENQGC